MPVSGTPCRGGSVLAGTGGSDYRGRHISPAADQPFPWR